MKVAIETYIYYHTQTPGYQVRKVKTQHGRRVYDVSRYFSARKYGSLRKAAHLARNWKYRHITRGHVSTQRLS